MGAFFNCSQADFILVVTTGLNSFFEFIIQFTAVSPKFKEEWGNTMRTDLADAEDMPDEDARNAAKEAVGVVLAEKAALARSYWQQLKLYIIGSFPESLVEIKLTAAGQRLYRQASGENWPATQRMLKSATNFIAANLEALTSSQEMPTTFPTEFNTVVKDFRKLLSDYEDIKETVMVQGQERLAALNDIHRRFMPMMAVGQQIFKDNEAVRTQFVFADVLARVGGHGLAGFKGKVLDNVTNLPISGAMVKMFVAEIPETEYTSTTNEDGEYEVNCPSGIYTVEVSATGYSPNTMLNKTVEVGTVSRLDVALSPVVPDEE